MNTQIMPLREFTAGKLRTRIYATNAEMGEAAATEAAAVIREAVEKEGKARVIFAAAPSQLTLVRALAGKDSISWDKVEGFQMDEYIGISADHPASFRRWMHEHVVETLQPGKFNYLEGDAPDPQEEARRYAALLSESAIHLTCMGIGENGHLAFNDPPVADFADPLLVKRVALDTACKNQQVGERHFSDLAAVPAYALTVTIPALIRARRIVCVVPRAPKADAVRRTIHGVINTGCPSSILREQAHATLYLDVESAGKLQPD